jgi:ATP-dependent helicase/nuclease subunit B
MALTLLAGPANAGKVARLLEQYVAELHRDPVLIVPNRSDVERVERELLRRSPALVGGSIGTFDDLFRRIARADGAARPVTTDAQRSLILRRITARAARDGLAASARFSGFADSLAGAIDELEGGLLEPADLEGELARLYAAYLDELDSLGLWDRELERRHAVERIAGELGAWDGAPVFAYGFEDLTAAEWALLESLAGRADVTVSLPYEPGRAAFASLRQTAEDLGALASGRIQELPAAYADLAPPALAYLERALFADPSQAAPPLDGAIRFFEGAGVRGELELIGEELVALMRAGTAPEEIGVVCPSLDRWLAPIETVFETLAIPYAVEAPVRLPQTPFGHALLALLRFAWRGGERRDLFVFLRSPFSGLSRHHVDFVEGRLRGLAVSAAERVEERMSELRGASLPVLDALRAASSPLAAARELLDAMLAAVYGVEEPPVGETSRQDLRTYEACRRVLGELEGWERLVGPVVPEELVAALERATVRPGGAGEPGRVPVLDLMRARTRRFEVVFVLGLEEGSLPRRGRISPFLDDADRARLGRRLQRPDQVSRDRYLFYTACSRPSRRLYLVREAATDDGSPRERSPFWEEVTALFPAEDVARWTRRRPLSTITWPLEAAPSERERLRALAVLSVDDGERGLVDALARANGWERRLHRAREAFVRPTRLRHPLVLEQLRERSSFTVTELERFADCSSVWFVERVLDPKAIDAEVDRRLRGSVAHTALFRFFSGLPRELGSERVEPARVEDAVRFMRRCLEQAVDGVRMEMTPMQRRELQEGLWRDLERVVRDEADGDSPLRPRQFEVSFGTERSAPELQRGLELADGIRLAGKIDRIDVDPFTARGIVQDYKAGKGAHSAREIERELRLQIPLYMRVLRDLVGIEPLGGLYRPLAGDRKARGILREEARDELLPGFVRTDYLDEDAFWSQVDGAAESARRFAGRIRTGDVRHDPKGGECPSWCDLWPMCRVRRA